VTGGEHVQGIADVWPDKKPLIGMVHLLPLPGSPRWSGSTDAALDRALDVAEAALAIATRLTFSNGCIIPVDGGRPALAPAMP